MTREKANKQLIEAAKRRGTQEILSEAGINIEGGLIRAGTGLRPKPEEHLPSPTHTFNFPLNSDQIGSLKKGDVIKGFPLSKVITAIRSQTTHWDEFAEFKAVSSLAEDLKCNLAVEAIIQKPNGEFKVRVQTNMPDTKYRNAKEAWGIEKEVFEINLGDFNTLTNSALESIKKLLGW